MNTLRISLALAFIICGQQAFAQDHATPAAAPAANPAIPKSRFVSRQSLLAGGYGFSFFNKSEQRQRSNLSLEYGTLVEDEGHWSFFLGSGYTFFFETPEGLGDDFLLNFIIFESGYRLKSIRFVGGGAIGLADYTPEDDIVLTRGLRLGVDWILPYGLIAMRASMTGLGRNDYVTSMSVNYGIVF